VEKTGGVQTMVCNSLTRLVAACGTCAACAACDGFGIARSTATTFGVFLWLQVKNFDVSLLHSALVRDFQPNRKQVWLLVAYS
jgi:hypothetical protein